MMERFTQEQRLRIEAVKMRLNRAEDRVLVADLVLTIERLRRKVEEQDRRIAEYGWERNPDRMGGQFTDAEILETYRNRW